MARRVILHVGAPKSGTSYLQQILWNNLDRLAEDGITMPGNRRAHYQAMGSLRGGVWENPDAPWTWDRLAAAVRDAEGTVLVSEEMLGAATTEQAETAVRSLGDAEVHVVVAERDLWRTIPSAWQQSVRGRTVGTFTAFVDALRTGANPGFWAHQFALPILERWGTLVPPERQHVITVPAPGTARAELWTRFCVVLGVDPDGYDLDQTPGNPSLGAPETELLRRLNLALGDEFPLSKPYLDVVRANLTLPVLMANSEPDKFGAPAHARDWVEQRSEAMVEALEAHPCNVIGDLDDLRPPVTAETRAPDDYSTEELLDVAVHTMVGMLRHTDARATKIRERAETAEREVRRLELQLAGGHTLRVARAVRERVRRARVDEA